MQSLPIQNHTRRLGAPSSWDHAASGICHTLEICDVSGWMISAWQPNEAERARIAAGAPIYLHVQGEKHPVVGLTIGDVQDVVSG